MNNLQKVSFVILSMIAILFFVQNASRVSSTDNSASYSIFSPGIQDTFSQSDVVLSIGATRMNVLYIGVNNPLSIAASHYRPEQLIVSASAGSIRRVEKHYEVKVIKTGKCTIQVAVREKDGSVRVLGSQEFRIRKLPKPVAKFGTIHSGGTFPRQAFLAQTKIMASMGGGFAFSGVRYKITSYQFTFSPAVSGIDSIRQPVLLNVKGNHIPSTIKQVLVRSKSRDLIVLDKIKATGPGGVIYLENAYFTVR